MDDRNATLSPHPRNLSVLWIEYTMGIGGRVAASNFTSEERGRCRFTYCNRNQVWACIKRLVNAGHTADSAIAQIHQAYGHNLSVTNIFKKFYRDRREYGADGHPNLRV